MCTKQNSLGTTSPVILKPLPERGVRDSSRETFVLPPRDTVPAVKFSEIQLNCESASALSFYDYLLLWMLITLRYCISYAPLPVTVNSYCPRITE
ncbi:hypothetical protein CDAR_74231 [Caerostris darwini]|uniref:Uncharacterized protein n=1 Tax=Caerostris darwini TaxID=1538125 RepID=A0AAV4UJG2_9ARAC|nr:hypothetical protein CDAR_74231 [Caerostris darwini]